MLMRRIAAFYVCSILIFELGIAFMLHQGNDLSAGPAGTQQLAPAGQATVHPSAPPSHSSDPLLLSGLIDNLKDPLSRLLIQLIVVVVTARAVGALFARIAQPAVVGEMVAGILLGPSLLGWLAPGVFDFIFPANTLGTLRMLSQIGVCLFLFVVGMELDAEHLRHRAQTAVVVSHVSILFPYSLGVALALLLFRDFAPPGTKFISFALFMGISMSITAFPVLARILEEKAISKTFLGVTAITCAAVDDVMAWIILAVVVAVVKAGSIAGTSMTLLLAILFVAFMLLIIRRALPMWIGRAGLHDSQMSKGLFAGVLLLVFLSALTTEVIGIHALFGAFIAGVAMPRHGQFRDLVKVRLDNFSSTFLLPIFFAFTGLRTHVGLLNDTSTWLICGGIILVATIGKLGGSMLAARCTGLGWNDAFSLGALMNTRGLVELIALNIGYDLGILSPRIFAMLVIMALVTTFLTGPLLSLAWAWKTKHALVPETV